MRILYFLIFMLSLSIVRAQADKEQTLRLIGNMTPYSPGVIGFDNRYQGIQGDPFLFSQWQLGRIRFVKQDTFSIPLNINIDLVKQVLVVQMRDGSSSQVTATNVKAIQTTDADQRLRRWTVLSEKEVENVNSVRLKFYEILHEGTFQLLKLTEKTFKKANYQGAYNVGNAFDEFVTEISYWLRGDGKKFTKVKMKRKEIESILPTSAPPLIKNQKLDLTNENDVIKLLGQLEVTAKQ